MKSVIEFMKKEIVLCISGILAICSAFIVKPSVEYIGYIDVRVLAILFCLMLIMSGYQKEGVFNKIAKFLLGKTRNVRQLALILIALCFVSSMLITNDVALITFVPFAILVLEKANKRKDIIYIVVLQTIAANLGSMFTPIGNPQNLYLYGISNMGLGEFLAYMCPLTIASAILLVISILFIKQDEITTEAIGEENDLNIVRVVIYTLLFWGALLTVARVVRYEVIFLISVCVVLITDRKLFKAVDYSLLITFVNFFIFIGNMGKIQVIRDMLEVLVNGREMLVAILSSQFISNVPAAILLAEFTNNFKMLILGVNIGGLGTLIASMASLISYKFYVGNSTSDKGKYIKVFTVMNVIFLIILTVISIFLYQ